MLHGKPCAKCREKPRLLRDSYCAGCRSQVNKDWYRTHERKLAAIAAEARTPEFIIARMKAARDRRLSRRPA